MDLANRVQYDVEFPVEIAAASGDKGAVVFYVKSLQSKGVQRIERLGRHKLIVGKQLRGDKGLTDDDIDFAETIERDRVIASFVRWDWGGNEFQGIGVDPEFTPENVAYVMDHPNSGWIVDKVVLGAANIVNFTKS